MKELLQNILARGQKVDKANYYYILVNIGLSAFSFVRSFVFMRVLDLKELGVISLVQTIFMFIGLLQMGLLNGGYRIISLGKKEEMERTNNTIYSYLAILLPLGILFCFLSSIFNWIKDLDLTLLIISVVFGIFTLLNNWYHNMLIGEQKLSEVNIANIISYTLSILLLPLAFAIGFWGGMSVIMIQPLAFVGVGMLRNKELRPTGFDFDLKYVKYILSFGFIPFLGGIFAAVYTQVERWSITDVLSVEALGGFYLVFLYVSLYQLVPTSINAIFFPKGVKSYSEGKYEEFKRYLKYYYLVLIGYGVVYYILPGLILQSMCEPIGLILNSAVILKPMLAVNATNLAFNVVSIGLMITIGIFTLDHVAMLRSLSGIVMISRYVITFLCIRKRLYPVKTNTI